MATSTLNAACHVGADLYQSPRLPADHRYQVVALVLQGGGALGSYQAGVYQGLAEADLHPNWVAGISIGALNAAIIAGNPPERRVERLQEFWQTICQPPFLPPSPLGQMSFLRDWPEPLIGLYNGWEAWRALTEGQNGFFVPRTPFNTDGPAGPGNASYYDTAPLKSTLVALVDFDRLNDTREMRVSVGAVNVKTGNFVYFDNTKEPLCAEHFMASGALPPGFPAVEIDGEYYWDGGVVSNTPLQQVLTTTPRKNSLVFQVDLWSSHGSLPTDLSKVALRQKDIQYSSRTRMITTYMANMQKHRRLLRELMQLVPEDVRKDNPWYRRAAEEACDRLFNVIHLIYKEKNCEGSYKDYQFGALTMREHWASGLADIEHSLAHPEWLDMPPPETPFITHDVHRF
ncbi:patatin-like phospholipase family protein [Crenobacter sp. SG2303]|uniref:Patatin-like phospholipase family protein n=1 Tax=Crenobacter oryzisoli TaxID=3056844 RepID=A0ABT7XNS1_9NEIS|nr:patatin-like phospholipase family protein [Crenobacter sp. SG2303]MDN0075435.1 patatin-like phospholipase family protein [Crenobacter sp. SG2303]